MALPSRPKQITPQEMLQVWNFFAPVPHAPAQESEAGLLPLMLILHPGAALPAALLLVIHQSLAARSPLLCLAALALMSGSTRERRVLLVPPFGLHLQAQLPEPKQAAMTCSQA